MKFTFHILVALIFFSCSKNEIDKPEVIGTWQWIESVGGIAGSTTPNSIDESWQLRIGHDQIELEFAGTLQSSKYYIEEKYSEPKARNYCHFNTEKLVYYCTNAAFHIIDDTLLILHYPEITGYDTESHLLEKIQ